MAEQPNRNNNSDEIDLGQLFQMIGRGFNKLGIAFLRLFLYLKKRAFILGGLILLGFGIGYGLNQITEESKKIEVIVQPNLDTENYLYDIVSEIESNIKSGDTAFFKELGLKTTDVGQLGIKVEPIEVDKSRKGDLELFEKFKDNPNVSDIIKNELLKNSALDHRIIFSFKNVEDGKVFAKKAMNYINSNQFFHQLIATSNENAQNRIKQNESLINQIDLLIKNYTASIGEDQRKPLDDKILLDNEKPIDITGLLQLKNRLIQNIELKKMELMEQKESISILNFGKPQKVTKAFFGKRLVLFPVVLLGMFFLWELLKFLNGLASKIDG